MENLYDLADLEALAMGDTDFMKELLAANVESIEAGIDIITQSHTAGDYDTMGKEAHKIKPLLAMLKADSIHKTIVDIEYYSRKEFNPDVVNRAYQEFIPLAPMLLSQLKELIA
jgi:HPt (histidine-containing phosphotransfer) domain-containing protein